MKISISEDRHFVLEEVYLGVLLRTREGDGIGVCIRDGTFEINIIPKGSKENNWWVINWQEGTVEKMGPKYSIREAVAYLLEMRGDYLHHYNQKIVEDYLEELAINLQAFHVSLTLLLDSAKNGPTVMQVVHLKFTECIKVIQSYLDSQNPDNANTNSSGT